MFLVECVVSMLFCLCFLFISAALLPKSTRKILCWSGLGFCVSFFRSLGFFVVVVVRALSVSFFFSFFFCLSKREKDQAVTGQVRNAAICASCPCGNHCLGNRTKESNAFAYVQAFDLTTLRMLLAVLLVPAAK